MRLYRERLYFERLRVPVSWWLVSAACVLILGTTLWAGFSVATGLLVYLVMGGLLALALLTFGAVTVEVTPSDLVVGPRTLALRQITEISAMDGAQTTALRGPRADASAYLLIRPYLPESVYFAVAGQPYWLIGTRRPAELAAAVTQARSRIGESGACDDDDPDDHVMQAGTGSSAKAARQRKDGNAW
jgi:hypothetical protein